jgi:RNA 2',3'-cyclic 3'-phosphodiesterase
MAQGAVFLARLADAVAERCATLGHERDARQFRPHLTLARCRAPADVRAAVGALGGSPVGPAWTVDAMTVFESRLRSGGAEYVARATVPLRAGSLPA